MKVFNVNDTIFARATAMGREIINIRLTGIASMRQLLELLRSQLSIRGLISLTIRNLTQGWSQTQAYRFA